MRWRCLQACGHSADALSLVALGYAAELLSLNAVDLAANPREAAATDRADRGPGRDPPGRARPRGAAHRRAARAAGRRCDRGSAGAAAGLLGRDLGVAVDAAPGGELERRLARRRRSTASSRARRRPGPLEHGRAPVGTRDHRLTIDRLHPPPAVLLLATPAPQAAEAGRLLLSAAAPVLAALLDREALLAQEHSAQESVASSVERRLARLRYDLHDGPQQDVHLLAQDLDLFREQLRPMIAGDPNAGRLIGRLDDLDAQLVALDGDLRRLSSAVQSPFLHARLAAGGARGADRRVRGPRPASSRDTQLQRQPATISPTRSRSRCWR